MSRKETVNDGKRVPLVTRTQTVELKYMLYTLKNGALNPIGEVVRTEKFKQSELNTLSKEHGEQVVADVIEEKTQLIGMTVEDFVKNARPVENGKLK